MQQRRIDSRLNHRRHRTVFHAFLKPRGEIARSVIQIPIEGFREIQTLGGIQPERMNIGDEQGQSGQLLTAGSDAELRGLLDRVDRIAAGVGQSYYVSLGRLRLKEE